MPKMERVDDLAVVFATLDFDPAAVTARFVLPRAMRLIKVFAVNYDLDIAAIVTFASPKGPLTDTLTIPAGAVGDVTSKDIRPEPNNAFAEGAQCTITSNGGPSPGSGNAGLTLIFRPL